MSVFLNQDDPGLKFPLKISHEQALYESGVGRNHRSMW